MPLGPSKWVVSKGPALEGGVMSLRVVKKLLGLAHQNPERLWE